MTAQISDCYKYKEKNYNLVAISEKIGFNPEEYGITPFSRVTSCWRGYWCEYEIVDDKLLLQNLFIYTENEEYPTLFGVDVSPTEYRNYECYRLKDGEWVSEISKEETNSGHRKYANLAHPMEYTGKILLGDGFIDKYYIHMGYQRAYAYKELVEFVFEKGRLLETIDHSEDAKKLRKEMDKKYKDLRHPDDGDIMKFVQESFSTDYGVKAWWL